LATTDGNNTGVASGGEIVALVPGPDINLTRAMEATNNIDAGDVVQLNPASGAVENLRSVSWVIPGGIAHVESTKVPDDVTWVPFEGEGVKQVVRGKLGTRIDENDGPAMGDDVVILNWQEVPGLHVAVRVETTELNRVAMALEIAEELRPVDAAGWTDRTGPLMAEQRRQEEAFASDRAEKARAVAEARFAADPDLRTISGQTIDGTPFEVASLDLDLVCLTLGGSDLGCTSTPLLSTNDSESTLGRVPSRYGFGEGDQQLLYGSLGLAATRVVVTTESGEPTTVAPLLNDGLWALPLAADEHSVTLVFLDEDGGEVHRVEG
jgi:hypothetical protein